MHLEKKGFCMCSTLFLIVHLLQSPEKALSGQSFEKDGKTTSKFLNRSWDQQQFSPSADEARVGKKRQYVSCFYLCCLWTIKISRLFDCNEKTVETVAMDILIITKKASNTFLYALWCIQSYDYFKHCYFLTIGLGTWLWVPHGNKGLAINNTSIFGGDLSLSNLKVIRIPDVANDSLYSKY